MDQGCATIFAAVLSVIGSIALGVITVAGVYLTVQSQWDATLATLDANNIESERNKKKEIDARITELKTERYLLVLSAFAEINRILSMIPLVDSSEMAKYEMSIESAYAMNHKDLIASTELYDAINDTMLQAVASIQTLKIGRKRIEDTVYVIGFLKDKEDVSPEMLERLMTKRDTAFRELVKASIAETGKVQKKYHEVVRLMRSEIELPSIAPQAFERQIAALDNIAEGVAKYHTDMRI